MLLLISSSARKDTLSLANSANGCS